MTSLSIHDAYKNESWYFGVISREDAQDILTNESCVGAYLIRASSSPGHFALSVREKVKVTHYKIEALPSETLNDTKYKLGTIEFKSIHALLRYYEKNNLSDTPLTTPAKKPVYYAAFDFKPIDSDGDLPLRKYDKVTFLGYLIEDYGKSNKEWWEVLRISDGQSGYVPSSYLQRWDETIDTVDASPVFQNMMTLPAAAVVVRPRRPNLFDSTMQLRLLVDEEIEVQAYIPETNYCFGRNLKTNSKGWFPFSYVRIMSGSDKRESSISNGNSSNMSQISHLGSAADLIASEML